jgi:hypothetical protein
VLALMHRKTTPILAVVLACVTIILVIECQMHDLPFEHTHAVSTGHHHSHNAPGNTTGGIPCLLAMLPLGIVFPLVAFMKLNTVDVLSPSAVPPLLPFVPPRKVAY